MKKYLTKKNIIIFSIIFIFTSLINYYFFIPHYAIDTYRIASLGYIDYFKYAFFPVGRLISSILYLIFHLFKIKLSIATVISFIIGLFFSTLSTFAIYKSIIPYFKDNYINKIIILLISFLALNNYFFIQLNLYCESCVMWIGVFSAIIAAIIFTSNTKKKLLKTFLLLLISIFSYQSALPIFITYTSILMLFKQVKFKEFIINIIVVGTLYCLAAFVNLFFIYVIVNKLLGIWLYKVSTRSKSLQEYIIIFKKYFDIFFNSSLYYPNYGIKSNVVKYYLLFTSLLVIIANANKKNFSNIFNYIITIMATIIFSILPMLGMDMTNLYFSSKMFIGALILFPISFAYILFKLNKKTINYIFLIPISIIFVYNFNNCLFVNNEYKNLNNAEKNDAITITNKIKEYEKNTNIKINNFFYNCDSNPTYTSPICNAPQKSYFTQDYNSLYQQDFINDVLYYYGNINIEKISIKYMPDCKNSDRSKFDDSNLIFENDTIYVCYY